MTAKSSDYVEHDSYVEGPKFAFPSGWLERAVIDANADLDRENRIEIVRVRETTTWFTRTIIFTIGGKPAILQAFMNALKQAIEDYNR